MLEDSQFKSYEQMLSEGRQAAVRTVVNVGLVAFDIFPLADAGLGHILSVVADGAKTLRTVVRVSHFLRIDPKFLDLTPDVSLKVALDTEAVEFVAPIATLGLFNPLPTHSIETLLQIKHDLPRMRDALGTLMRIAF